jgi:hypothetical protein
VHWAQVDASHDRRAERFAAQVLEATPRGAVLFAKGDRAVFSLWYFHFALGQRPDLVVIASDLLPYAWYQETLRSTYPDLDLPALPLPEALRAANPSRPACNVIDPDEGPIRCTVGAN